MMNGGHRNTERLRPVDRPGVLHDHRHPHRLDRAINLAGTINEPSRNYMRPIGRAGRVPRVGKKKGGTICDVATEGRTIEEPLQGKASVGWPTGSPKGINRYCTGDDPLWPNRSGYERSGNRRVPLKPEKRQRTIRQTAGWGGVEVVEVEVEVEVEAEAEGAEGAVEVELYRTTRRRVRGRRS